VVSFLSATYQNRPCSLCCWGKQNCTNSYSIRIVKILGFCGNPYTTFWFLLSSDCEAIDMASQYRRKNTKVEHYCSIIKIFLNRPQVVTSNLDKLIFCHLWITYIAINLIEKARDRNTWIRNSIVESFTMWILKH
jgi:hypothetical protein